MGAVLPVFVGFDTREAQAAAICAKSLHRHASVPLHVQWLHEPSLRHIGLYRRTWEQRGPQRIDCSDGKPFSTAFSFSRFLVPALMQYCGVALYCDCDFLFLSDVAALLELFDPNYAVQVVKHDHRPAEGIKMDGQAQQPYHRKNWSSCILWNCGHPANMRLTPHAVSIQSGQWLHAFSWLDDDDIGELPASWNWLSGVNPVGQDLPDAVHFTLGTPDMPGHENEPLAELWRLERDMPSG